MKKAKNPLFLGRRGTVTRIRTWKKVLAKYAGDRSAREVAAALGVPRNLVYQWQMGRCAPSGERRAILVKKMGV